MTLRYFTFDEFKCSETGENQISPQFVQALDFLREKCGFPFVITSGYRSPDHSIEKAKDKPGRHSEGIAADIKVNSGSQRFRLVQHAIEHGFTGIGIAKTFVHLDRREGAAVMWVYD